MSSDLVGRVGVNVAVDVGVAVDQLVAQRVGHVAEIERALFLAQFRIEHHVQQQVAQLLLDALHIVVGDGIGQFVSLLDGVAAQRVECAGSLSNELASRLGKKNPAKGVKVELLPRWRFELQTL